MHVGRVEAKLRKGGRCWNVFLLFFFFLFNFVQAVKNTFAPANRRHHPIASAIWSDGSACQPVICCVIYVSVESFSFMDAIKLLFPASNLAFLFHF